MIQVGADPEDHLVLDELSTQEISWLMAARLDALLDDPMSPVAAHDVRLPPLPAGSRLPGLLGRRGFLHVGGPASHPLPGGVRLEGIDVITLAAAQLLVQVGVRRFDLIDSRQVDLPLAGVLPTGSLGTPRTSAVAAVLAGLSAHVSTGRLASPDMVIVSASRSCDPSTVGVLMAEDQEHLLVVQRERSITVGPRVVPGRTPCSHCVELHLSDRDPRWPFVMEEVRVCPLPAPTTAARHIAALEMARAALGTVGPGLLGGNNPWGSEPCVVHVAADGALRAEPTRPHPRCGCASLAVVLGPDSVSLRHSARTSP
ncbi:MAG: hypothetical protein ACTJGR_00290 [Pauljensenia sp.]